jgi:CBS domain-containing protein
MRIEQIMTRPVQYCRPEDTLARAAQLMWDHDCGCLPVCSSDGATRILGVITDRDMCMHALFEGKPLTELRVSEAMAQHVRACKPSDTVADAERTMREAQIRRLPVVDRQGRLVGMVSLADLAQEAARERTATTKEITETEIGDTLAAICQPQGRQLAA